MQVRMILTLLHQELTATLTTIVIAHMSTILLILPTSWLPHAKLVESLSLGPLSVYCSCCWSLSSLFWSHCELTGWSKTQQWNTLLLSHSSQTKVSSLPAFFSKDPSLCSPRMMCPDSYLVQPLVLNSKCLFGLGTLSSGFSVWQQRKVKHMRFLWNLQTSHFTSNLRWMDDASNKRMTRNQQLKDSQESTWWDGIDGLEQRGASYLLQFDATKKWFGVKN